MPFVRFRKQMSRPVRMLTAEDYEARIDPAAPKEYTLFVVNSAHIYQFLHAFCVDDSNAWG